jgi:type III secretion protein L
MKFFSLIFQGEVHPSTDEKVIPAKDFSQLVKVSALLKKAEEDVDNAHKEMEKEAQRLKAEAKKEGFQEGLEQFNEHLLSFEAATRTLRLELQQQIIPIALKAAKKVVAAQLELKPETIVDIILQALTPAVHSRRVIIYVNKEDKEILEARKSKIKEILDQLQTLNIQERADISPGGCIIETEAGIINVTIENQWRALEAAFEKYTRGG